MSDYIQENRFPGKKTVRVAAAVIHREDCILAMQRGYGVYKDFWEFPGGKIEPGETPEEALIREIHEELNAEIQIESKLCQVEYDYPEFHLSMSCYWSILRSEMQLLEHESARWLTGDALKSVNWLPADRDVIIRLQSQPTDGR